MGDCLKVLVVDDDPRLRTLLRDLFEHQTANVDVECAGHGKEALKKFSPGKFDCIVTDVQMPKMDGIELCQSIKSNSGVPVVLHSGIREGDGLERIRNSGADEFLHKNKVDPTEVPEVALGLARKSRDAVLADYRR